MALPLETVRSLDLIRLYEALGVGSHLVIPNRHDGIQFRVLFKLWPAAKTWLRSAPWEGRGSMDKIKNEFRGRHFTADVILWAVRWYPQFPISGSGANFRDQCNETLGNITRFMRREQHSRFRAPCCL